MDEQIKQMPVPLVSGQFQRLKAKALANRRLKGPQDQFPIPGTQAEKLEQVAQRTARLPYKDEE